MTQQLPVTQQHTMKDERTRQTDYPNTGKRTTHSPAQPANPTNEHPLTKVKAIKKNIFGSTAASDAEWLHL